jgi:hypothetical protein
MRDYFKKWIEYYVNDFYPNYDEDKIAKILKDNGFKKVRKGKKYGYSNQPVVVMFEGNKNTATDILEKEFENYISVYEKDWGRKMADGGFMEDGGVVGEKFTISAMREKLGSMFPDSFGFTVGTISPQGNKSVNSSALITNPNDPFRGLKDEDINSKLFFPQYKKLHDIRFRIYQGGENTYFYFNFRVFH